MCVQYGYLTTVVNLKSAQVLMQGVIDTVADITIVGGTPFQKVASATRLKKKDFKPSDITPHTYHWQNGVRYSIR